MSRPKGSIIGARPTWTTTATSGIWTLRQAEEMKAAGQWPRGPVAPTSLAGTVGDQQVALTWVAPATPHGTITDYVVEYTPAAGSPTVVAIGSTAASYTLTGLTNGTEYTFRVAAVNHTRGDWSSSVAVTPTASVPDPQFANVALLLHADNTTADSSGSPKTMSSWSSYGEGRFGAASFSFSGTTPGVTVVGADTVALGTGDFTVELWFRTSNGGLNALYSAGAGQIYIITNSGWVQAITGSAFLGGGVGGGPYADDAWHHVALVRESGQVALYADGSRLATGSSSSNLTSSQSNDPQIGSYQFSNWSCTGLVDEVRVTKFARYSGETYTVPTAAFPDA